MNSQIFLIMLFLTQSSYSTITQECFCNQMYTLSDCRRKDNCDWNDTQQMCVKQENDQTPVTPQPDTQQQIPSETVYPSYCGQFTTNDVCASMKSCEWNGKTCTHFTSCTAYTFNNEQDCQKISYRCSTDGVHCIEKTTCIDYKTKQACNENNDGKYCLWNEKCEDANSCDELPLKLNSDALCRAQISICTAKVGGGCIESGINCSNQISEIGCVSNKIQSKTCFWKEDKCFDRTCDSAPNFVTDKDCKEFLSICTTKQDGGCVIRSQCSDAKTAEACITDVQNKQCFWNGDSCHIQVCEDAPINLLTNQDCNNFLNNCITNGNGCINNTGCEAAIIQVACDISPQGQKCHWDGSECKLQTCENAGPNYIGHEACNTYMSNCTAKVGAEYGCTEISCLSAPLINNTNNYCELYLPGNNCITKLGGGCKVNKNCSDIDIEIACIKDINNKICFWHEGKCYLKTCDNAPSTYNSNKQCSDFLESCTFGNDIKCIDKVCENVDNQEDCTFDFYMNPCIMKSGCKAKQCNIASKSFITHIDCYNYLPTCTLDNSGSGCMDLPDQCSQITINEGCKINKIKSKCGWNGSNCIDYNCSTAPDDLNTTSKCQEYKSGCVVNNTLNGCMDLPNDCSNRLKQDNCEIYQGSIIKCLWNLIDNICINITCENAHKTSQLVNVTQNNCWNYFGLNCIININSNQCLQRPSSCQGLAKDACQQSKILSDNSDCYWDIASSACKIKACSSITFTFNVIINHDTCFKIMNNCTISNSLDGCIDLKSCDLYDNFLQCVIDTNNYSCIWNGNDGICESKLCSTAKQNSEYTSDEACQLFSKNCTASQQLCSLKKSKCEDYNTQSGCEQNTISNLEQCVWMVNMCIPTQFDCLKVTGSGLLPEFCFSLNPLCSANVARTQCVTNYGSCMMYQEQDCLWGNIDGYCKWNETQCELDCSAAPGPYFDIDYCNSYNFSCTAKLDASGCVKMEFFCASTLPENCTKATEGYCYKSDGSCVSSSTMPLSNCASVTGVRLPIEYCLMISMFQCGTNTSFTSCVLNQSQCSDYSQKDCVATLGGKCIYQNGACIDMPFSADMCGSIIIDGLTSYTDFHCNQYQPYVCIANDTKTGCTLKPTDQSTAIACNTYTGKNLTYQYCVSKSTLCSVNLAKTNCIDTKQLCNEYSVSECFYAVQEGECVVLSNQCIQKSCDNAPLTAIDTAGCQAYSTNCISQVGGCQTRSTCTSYIKQNACVKSLDGKDCLWNPTVAKCVNKTCAGAENTTNFNTDSKCSTLGNCTVKSTGLGCMSRNFCGSYTIYEQCKVNDKGIACVWNTNNPSLPVCSDKSCSTAPFTITSHQDCISYLSGCTVNLVNSLHKGCTNFVPCTQYKSEDQCRISSEKDLNNINIICDWNGSICGNKSCMTANNTYNTHSKCSNYFIGCTVNSTNNGCIEIPNTCESMNQFQCFDGSVDSNNNQCMWNNNQCITKTCLNSPKSDNESDCESHLSSCTLSFFSCKTSICEEFQFPTESECLNALPNGLCTSNGSSCIQKVNCSDSKTELGCTIDKQGRECQWVTNNDNSNICSLKSCDTAPKSLKTEEECMKYYQPEDGSTCTSKLNGGCIIKGDCTTLKIDTFCTKDNKGIPCVWDTDTQNCRYPGCKDLIGFSFKECNTANNKCTVGLNGRCTNLIKCEDIKNRNICIQGSNGPCLWIAEFKNTDSTYGACFPYEQCSSFNWTTHEQCQLISTNCTTNGRQCIGITTCNETNTQGGCNKGTDGVCVQTPVTKDSKDLICKKFTICNDVYYLSHDECYKANNSCTSDYQNGCISLNDCTKYTIEGQCLINHLGIVKNNDGSIISTGKCFWDQNNNLCKDQTCKDIQLTTELACSLTLKDCTSDGINCLKKGNCESYLSKEACEIAGGIDGMCFWVEANQTTTSLCRLKVCSDIINGNTNLQCSEVSNCISDGIKCIEKSKCSTYITQPACLSQGIDGQCVWAQEKCSLMTQCSDAQSEIYCNQAKDRCSWSFQKKCVNHTCQTYQTQENKCKFFFSFDMKNYNYCALQAGICKEIDPIAFNEDQCYEMSGNLYSWNPFFEKCLQCEKKLINNIDEEIQENITLYQYHKDYFWIAMAYLAIQEIF